MSLDAVPRPLLVAIAVIAVLYAAILGLRGVLGRARMQRRMARGREGEREAASILEAHGFVLEGAQVHGGYALAVDDEEIFVRVVADYLVTDGGARFVAEVKTGKRAPKIETAATRRQLLEYERAFDVDGLLLVDADAGEVRRISFAPRARRRAQGWGGRAVLIAVTAVVAVVASYLAR